MVRNFEAKTVEKLKVWVETTKISQEKKKKKCVDATCKTCETWVSSEDSDKTVTFRSLLRPMMAVGVKAKDRKWDSGNQNQNWVNTSRPTMEGMCVCPVRDCREMVTFRPPADMEKDWFKKCNYSSKFVMEIQQFNKDSLSR